jgi:tRNA threonylcarbamoyladenosine biosynthesis protein TsaB
MRGSVALLTGKETVALRRHEGSVDYSECLLPMVEEVLAEAGTSMESVELFAVATGPGSFTGLRVGLTTVKAWAEVYRKPVVGVSRLEAMAHFCGDARKYVAAFYDAQRGQLFGGLYQTLSGRLARVGEEVVISPEGLLDWVDKEAGAETVSWISLDPEVVTGLAGWKKRLERGDTMESCTPELAPAIGVLAEERAGRGEYSDTLELDANYVRRSDAEIFWKRR